MYLYTGFKVKENVYIAFKVENPVTIESAFTIGAGVTFKGIPEVSSSK